MDRIIEAAPTDAPEMPEVLTQVLRFLIKLSKEKMDAGEEVYPFTGLAIKDKLFTEDASSETIEGAFQQARHTVEDARGADAYGFCYDGYINVDDRQLDAIIAEGGVPNDPKGYAIGLIYTQDAEGVATFEDEPTYIGPAPNFMSGLKDASEYTDDDLDEKYKTPGEKDEESAVQK